MRQDQQPVFERPLEGPQALTPEADALAAVPGPLAHRCKALPLSVMPEEITVAMADPSDVVAIDDLSAATKRRVNVVSAPETMIGAYLNQHYGPPATAPRQSRQSVAPIPPEKTTASRQKTEQLAQVFVGALFRPIIVTYARFYRALASHLRAGITLGRGLDLLADTGPKGFRPFCRFASGHLAQGKPLSGAMEQRPDLFDAATFEMVRAGEKSGNLDETFEELADHYEQEWESFMEALKGGALPLAESLAFMGVGVAMEVFPKSLPLLTVVLVAALAVLWRVVIRLPGISDVYDTVKSFIPLVGGITRDFATARFCRVAGSLYRAGVSLPQGFRLAANSCGTPVLKRQALRGAEMMDGGTSVRDALLQIPYLPAFVVEELSTAEVAGTLDDTFRRCAKYSSENGHTKLGLASKVAPVVLLVVYIGAAVSVLLPQVQMIGDTYRDAME